MSWQPIETAPKDRWILLRGGCTTESIYWDKYDALDDLRPVIARWKPNDPEDVCAYVEGWWVFAFWDGAWREKYEDPAEWMDIPV